MEKLIRKLLMSLLVLLPASSFSLEKFLIAQIEEDQVTHSQLKFAAKLHINSALKLLLHQYEKGSSNWVYTITLLAGKSGKAAYELALYYKQQAKNEQYLYWLKLANQYSFAPAQVMLAQYYYQAEQFGKVLNTTESVSAQVGLNNNSLPSIEFADDLLAIRAKSLLALGDVNELLFIHKKLWGNRYYPITSQLLYKLAEFNVFSVEDDQFKKVNLLGENTPSCQSSITLIGTQFDDLIHLKRMNDAFLTHPLNAYLCIQQIIYKPLKELKCIARTSEPIMCDESYWAISGRNIFTDYIGVMLPSGGANVHLGIMYFDRDDHYEIFIHELSHLLGFVDEYPLLSSHNTCRKPLGPKGVNISLLKRSFKQKRTSIQGKLTEQKIIRESLLKKLAWGNRIKSTTPILYDDGIRWVVGTPISHYGEIGVFPAETCNQDDYLAFKPFNKPTALRHTFSNFPTEYIDILTDNTISFAMPSFDYNIALSLYRKDKDDAATLWLKRSLKNSRNKKYHDTIIEDAKSSGVR